MANASFGALLLLLVAEPAAAAHNSHRHKHGLRRAAAFLSESSQIRSQTLQAPGANVAAASGVAGVSALDAHPEMGMPAVPEELDTWHDGQPLDTALGHYFASGVTDDIPVAPVGNLTDLTIMLGCPALMNWPSTVLVTAPDLCSGDGKGVWSEANSDPKPIVEWSTSCDMFSRNIAQATNYMMPNGDAFGTSQTATRWVGTNIVIRDCLGKVRFSIDEKVYHQEGHADQEGCKEYGSCDGTVYLQYLIRDQRDYVIGKTAYLKLFQDQFKVFSPDAVEIATVSRGGWDPYKSDCGPRSWTVAFSAGATGIWADASQRWLVAEMVTIMTLRDGYRRPSGLMRPSACELSKTVLLFGLALIAFFFFIFAGLIFNYIFLNRLRIICIKIEANLFPKCMKLPSRHQG